MTERQTISPLNSPEKHERPTFINEFPDRDIYCKLTFPENLPIEPTIINLLDTFQTLDGAFSPINEDIEVLDHVVMKFHNSAGSITVTYHPDGTLIFKQKGERHDLGRHVQYRDETKQIIPSDENYYEYVSRHIKDPLTNQSYSGSYLRTKHQFDVVNIGTGRVYKINGDVIKPIGGISADIGDIVMEHSQKPGPKLHQIEIKYRGTLNRDPQTNLTFEAVSEEIALLRHMVKEISQQHGIKIVSTKETKNSWIRRFGAGQVYPQK